MDHETLFLQLLHIFNVLILTFNPQNFPCTNILDYLYTLEKIVPLSHIPTLRASYNFYFFT